MSEYSKLLIMQYHKKPKAVATINAYCDESDKLSENLLDLLDQTDIDKARGFSLDIIGRRIGVSRNLPNAISKGFLGYYGSLQGEPWGVGRWYRKGETTGDSLALGDGDYKFLLKAKIYKNFQNGTLDYVSKVVKLLISPDAVIQDNAMINPPINMTANILLPISTLNELQLYMIQNMDILPRPCGVQYNYINASGKEFGFAGFFNSYGFNEGRFIDA